MNTEHIEFPNIKDEKGLREIKHAGDLIRQGKLVIFPTETVFGLGGNALDPEAAGKIYAAKGRPSDNPLIIHIAEPKDAEKYTYPPDLYYKLASHFMPGPLTVVLPSKPIVPKTVRAGLPTVAVRCPSDPVAHALISAAGVPIAAPSANLSGSPSPTCFAHVCEDMDGRVDMIIGGDCNIGVESTIVRIDGEHALTLLRPGEITLEELREIADVSVSDAVMNQLKEGEKVESPGMKYKHYAPKTSVFLLKGDKDNLTDFLISQNKKERIAVLSYREWLTDLKEQLPGAVLFDYGSIHKAAEQLHSVFFLLREADKLGCDAIYAPLPETTGLSLALYNRLIRASAYHIIDTADIG